MTDPRCNNPKLATLKAHVLGHAQGNSDMRCIIFCQTRELTFALKSWMLADNDLHDLNASTFTGKNALAERQGELSAASSQVHTQGALRSLVT